MIGDQPTETIGSWTGWGYWAYPNAGAFGIVNGAFKGGQNEGEPKEEEEDDDRDGKYIDDPIGIFTGALSLYHGSVRGKPKMILISSRLARSYNSKSQYSDGVLGRGWTHSDDITAKKSSNGFFAMGEQYALPAAATIAQLFVNVDIVSDTARPVAKITTMTLADAWWIDQMVNNSVVVSYPATNQIFIKQPDSLAAIRHQ